MTKALKLKARRNSEDEEFDEFEKDAERHEFEEDNEEGSTGTDSLMDELKQALAVGDEDRANELFEQIQRQ